MVDLSIKKVLILGSTGMAGHVITRYLDNIGKYDVINSSRSKLNSKTILIDINNISSVENLIKTSKPDIIINCIGVLIEESNKNPDKAIFINSYFPHKLESLGKKFNFKLIHLSTDCVFSGKKGNYSEKDFTDGKDYYSRSKALGEVINEKDLTFRTSIIGPELKKNGTGLFNWFMNQTEQVYGYKNVNWTGITTLELAKAIDHAIEDDLCSLYHLVPDQKISKLDLLKLIKEIWKKEIKILTDDLQVSDKSLINNRHDFKYKVSNYPVMLFELNKWMKSWNYEYK